MTADALSHTLSQLITSWPPPPFVRAAALVGHTYPTPIEPPTLVETVGAGCERCSFCCFGGGLAELSQHTLVLVRVGCAGTTTYRTCVRKITLWGCGGWGWC